MLTSKKQGGEKRGGEEPGRVPTGGAVELICSVGRLSYKPLFFEGMKAAAITNGNMVEELNTNDFAGINESSRDSQVFFRWFVVGIESVRIKHFEYLRPNGFRFGLFLQ